MKIVVKAKSLKHAFSRLRVAGLRVNVDELDEPKGRPEEWAERCSTPHFVAADGDVVFSVDVREEMANKIPTNDTPNFAVVWREDEKDAEGNPFPWPHYEVEEDGVTYLRGAGMFA